MPRTKQVDKWKQKEWYTIEAPEMFEEKEIRETPAASKEELIGRTLTVPLRDITGKRSHNNIKITFLVNEVEGETAKAQVKSFKLSRGYISKNIRKRHSTIKTVKDLDIGGNKLHTTAYAFTVNKIHSSKQREIREKINRKLEKEAGENSLSSLLQKMIFGKTATDIFKDIKIISPIKRVEVTKCEVERGE